MRKLFAFFGCMIALSLSIFAAPTNPSPFDLSTGAYSFNAWPATSPALTYPANMRFHIHQTTTPNVNTAMTDDWKLAYNLSSNVRIIGEGEKGFSFYQTGTKSTNGGFLGAAVLALNTTGRSGVKVSWLAKTLGLGLTPPTLWGRQYRIRLQYRTDSISTFKNVLDNANNVIEYISNVDTTHTQYFVNTLPDECNHMPYVEVRWLYYENGGSGSRAHLGLDSIGVSSDSIGNSPTKIIISNLSPNPPLSKYPFSFKVSAVNDSNKIQFVPSDVILSLSNTTGTGFLTGALVDTIKTGMVSKVFSGLVYNVAETNVTIQAQSVLLGSATVTTPFLVSADKLGTVNLLKQGHAGLALGGYILFPTFKVQAQFNNGSVDPNYVYPIRVEKSFGPGLLKGDTILTAVAGSVDFSNIYFTTPGKYVLKFTSSSMTAIYSDTILVSAPLQLTDIAVPKYMKSASNLTRVPVYGLFKLDNLLPNSVYRIFSTGRQVGYTAVDSSIDNGAGNAMVYNQTNNKWSYIESFFSAGLKNSLNTDSCFVIQTGANETTKNVWFSLYPTANASFNTGLDIKWIFYITNERGDFVQRIRSVSTTKTLEFGADTNSCSGIYDMGSLQTEKNILFLYADTATNARPVSSAFIQNDGVVIPIVTTGTPTSPALFYSNLDNVATSWATIIPNNAKNGIVKLELRDINGAITKTWTDNDGIWAGVDTRLASAGLNGIKFETPYIKLNAIGAANQVCNNGSAQEVKLIARGVSIANLLYSNDGGVSYIQGASSKLNEKSIFWNIPRGIFNDKPAIVQVQSAEHNYIKDFSPSLEIYDAPSITSVTSDALYCPGDNITISVVANGWNVDYQWYKDGRMMVGDTKPNLIFPNASYLNSANYKCLVGSASSLCSDKISNDILVYVGDETLVLKEPQDVSLTKGQAATFEVEYHTVGAPPSYPVHIQWYRGTTPLVDDGVKIFGATSPMLMILNIASSDFGDYHATVKGLCGAVVSTRTAKMNQIGIDVSIPKSFSQCEGESVTIMGIATPVNYKGGMNYQWQKDGVNLVDGGDISGAQSPNLTIANFKTANGWSI